MRVETIGDATLYLGDCREILPTLPKVDAVITDPPYGIGFRYGMHVDDAGSYADLIAPLRGMPVALLQYPEEMFRLVAPVLGPPDECLAWVYPSNLPRQFRLWGLWGLRPDFRRVTQPAKNPNCAKVKSLEVASYDWWEQPQVKGNGGEKTDHPCQIPVSLVDRVMRLVGCESVADPFLGSGTSGIACAQRGIEFHGIEKDPRYFDIACRRIEDAQRQGRLIA